MQVAFQDQGFDFVPWRPVLGRVFDRAFSFDSETTRIDDERNWLTPAYVLGAAFDGKHGVFVSRDRLTGFFAAHADADVAFHNAPFDLDVIATAAPDVNLYDRVDANLVRDTQIMHRLLTLGEEGHTAFGKDESSLECCASKYLGVALPKDVVDASGNPIRLSYGKWLGRPLGDVDRVYLEYLAKDAIATYRVHEVLLERSQSLLRGASDVWGHVSEEWLRQCVARFGLQTHHIQLKAAIVLRAITANGLHLDTGRRADLAKALQSLLETQKAELHNFGYLPGGKGANRSLEAALRQRTNLNPGLTYPQTDSGRFATAYDALCDLANDDPFVKALLEFRETEKLLGSFVGKMARPVLHPSFNVLARSGRTSSFGQINAQNLPKSDDVRACFVPGAGFEFIDADYATIELSTLAQACMTQFGLDSKMAAAINAGEDLHKLVAARMLGIPIDQVTKAQRQKAKPVNFGKPGGMGTGTLSDYAKLSYGVVLTPDEAEALSNSWFDQFPEMRAYLGDQTDTALELAELLDLTPVTHFASTSDRRFLGHPDNAGREEVAHEILGMMLLKVIGHSAPTTARGKPYSPEDIEYFWSRLDAVTDRLRSTFRNAIRVRQPSRPLQRAVMGLVGRRPVFTLSGRLRAQATYSARHNTIFQGLAADGAKLALWRLWRAGYRIVNFVHDQVLIEVLACSPEERLCHARQIREHMIQGMMEVVPDVRIDVSFAAMTRWYKNAEAVFDGTGTGLLVWEPLRAEGRSLCLTSATQAPKEAVENQVHARKT